MRKQNFWAYYLTQFSISLDGILLRLANLGNLLLFVSCPINIQGRELYINDFTFFLKSVCWLALWHSQARFFQTMMIEATELYILIPVWTTLTFIEGFTLYNITKACVFIFLQIFPSVWMKFCVAITCWYVEAQATLILYDNCARERIGPVILWNIPLAVACVGTLVNQFVSNLVWCWSQLNKSSAIPVWLKVKVTGLQEI